MNMETQTATPAVEPDRIDPAQHVKSVAQELLGDFNPALSTKTEWRYGARGSLSVDLERGTFYDHEQGHGGGVLDLIVRERGGTRHEAAKWLEGRESVPIPSRPATPAKASLGRIVATYHYHDEAGGHLFDVVRFEPKDFRQRAPDGSWKVKGVRKVLYRLPAISAAPDGATVYIVEGEKDVHRLEAEGLLATTNPGGAGKWHKDYAANLKGKQAVIVPDNDQAGRDHAETVRASLARHGITCGVLNLLGLADKGDVADWLDKGNTAADLERLGQDALRKAPDPKPTDDHNEIDLTEDGVALHFTAKFGGRLRFDHDQGRWFEWKGDHWKPDSTHLAYSFCRQIARELSEGTDDKERKTVRKAAFAAGVERMARSDRAHAVTSEQWDTDPFLLGCPGVTIDLRTGQHMRPDPVNGITRQAAVAPARGDCPLWIRFLTEVCEGDPEMIRFLQQWAGYCLTGDTREHALLFVYGPGGNGKSVFLETMAHILGDYAATSSMDTFTASKNDRHPTDLAMLRGARMVSASETEEGRAWAESRIKQLTGGDQITARFMRQDFFTYTPQFKLTVVGNHKPVLRNVDDAARRRFNIVPFTVKPQTPDPQLVAKLKAEGPAILQWMIEGCLDWRRNGLVRPRKVLDATAEYFDDQDLFGQWLEEACRVEPENHHLTATPKELFEAWQAYALAAGEQPGTQTALGNALNKRGLAKQVRKIGGKSARMWHGIALYRPDVEAWQGRD